MSDSVWPHRRQPTRLPRPWDSPGKNTGLGCHFLFQCMKVKVKSLSCVRLLETPWTAAYQAPPSMGFSRQKYWSGVPLPSPPSRLIILQLVRKGEPNPMVYENWFVSKSALQHRQKGSILLINGVRKIGNSYGRKMRFLRDKTSGFQF